MFEFYFNAFKKKILTQEKARAASSSRSAIVSSLMTFKGGVGKTTLTFNLASFLVRRNYKVLLIDLDPQANLTMLSLGELNSTHEDSFLSFFEVLSEKIEPQNAILQCFSTTVEEKQNLHLIPSNSLNSFLNQIQNPVILNRLKVVMKNLKSQYDFIFFDCPPTASISHALAVLASDVILSPVFIDSFSLQGIFKTFDDVNDICHKYNHQVNHKVIFNKVKSQDVLLAERALKIREILPADCWIQTVEDYGYLPDEILPPEACQLTANFLIECHTKKKNMLLKKKEV